FGGRHGLPRRRRPFRCRAAPCGSTGDGETDSGGRSSPSGGPRQSYVLDISLPLNIATWPPSLSQRRAPADPRRSSRGSAKRFTPIEACRLSSFGAIQPSLDSAVAPAEGGRY